MTVRDVMEITRQYKISVCQCLIKPGKVVGIVTNRDLRFETNLDPVKAICDAANILVTVVKAPALKMLELLRTHRLERA